MKLGTRPALRASRATRRQTARATPSSSPGTLHDLGRAAVPNGIWDKPQRLGAAEWERVRLHPYYTERILARTGAFAALATLAGAHHERLDGLGVAHRGLAAPWLTPRPRAPAGVHVRSHRARGRGPASPRPRATDERIVPEAIDRLSARTCAGTSLPGRQRRAAPRRPRGWPSAPGRDEVAGFFEALGRARVPLRSLRG